MSDLIESINDSDFNDKVLNAKLPVLVDFWANWCGPCKMIAPILEKLAEQYKDRLTIVKVDVDKNTEKPAHYGVRGIPTLMLFKDGEVIDTMVGALSQSELQKHIDKNL